MAKPGKTLLDGAGFSGEDLARALGLIRFSTDSAEQLLKLQMEVAQSIFAENIQSALALAQVTDPKDAIALRARVAQEATQNLLQHAKRLCDAALDARARLLSLSQSGGASDRAERTTAGSRMDEPLQAMMSSAGAAAQAMSDAARQVSERVQSGMGQAAAGFAPASGGTTQAKAAGKRRSA